jgi:hypothetical protein
LKDNREDFDPYFERSKSITIIKLTTMLQIARPQSTLIPIPVTRGLKEIWSVNPGTVKVHSRTGNFSCANEEYSEEDRVSTGIDNVG